MCICLRAYVSAFPAIVGCGSGEAISGGWNMTPFISKANSGDVHTGLTPIIHRATWLPFHGNVM